MRPNSWFALLVIVFALTVTFYPTVAQDPPATAQDLPDAHWYMVLLNDTNNQLTWVNGNGVQAITGRNKRPNETEDVGVSDVRIAPDGRHGFITFMLTDGIQGLGFYDFQRGGFYRTTHSAQLGERIALGRFGQANSFTSDSSRVAISFYTLSEGHISDWRIIEFDIGTTESTAILQKSDNAFQATEAFPTVYYAADDGSYHFYMTPIDEGVHREYEAFAWAPNGNSVTSLGKISSEFDSLPGTGALVESFMDETLTAAQPFGLPVFNALNQRASLKDDAQRLVDEEDSTLLYPHWAHNGEWIAYNIVGPDQSSWALRPSALDVTYTHPSPLPTEFYGTSDGYIVSDGKRFSASTEITGSDTHIIYEIPEGSLMRVVYITPQNATFAAMTLRPPRQIAVPLPTDTTCPGALTSRVSVGMSVRVLPDTGLNVVLFDEPMTFMKGKLEPGTEFVIQEGPTCQASALWWKVSGVRNGEAVTGWVKEGELNTYYLEPLTSQSSAVTATPDGQTMGVPFSGVAGSLNGGFSPATITPAPSATPS